MHTEYLFAIRDHMLAIVLASQIEEHHSTINDTASLLSSHKDLFHPVFEYVGSRDASVFFRSRTEYDISVPA